MQRRQKILKTEIFFKSTIYNIIKQHKMLMDKPNKNVQCLYSENSKTLMTEIKENLNK